MYFNRGYLTKLLIEFRYGLQCIERGLFKCFKMGKLDKYWGETTSFILLKTLTTWLWTLLGSVSPLKIRGSHRTCINYESTIYDYKLLKWQQFCLVKSSNRWPLETPVLSIILPSWYFSDRSSPRPVSYLLGTHMSRSSTWVLRFLSEPSPKFYLLIYVDHEWRRCFSLVLSLIY